MQLQWNFCLFHKLRLQRGGVIFTRRGNCFELRRYSSQAAPARRKIGKLLIANRGEIACRIALTARKLGVKTVAVYSDADRNSQHLKLTDESVHIGPAASSQSYLNASAILNAAQTTASQAIHPGYGFLSESTEFAQQCSDSGIIFVGPPPSAIRDMGIKSVSKRLMEEAGVPVIPGYHGDDQSLERLKSEAINIGYPILIKPVRGGGGKGMRVVHNSDDFETSLESSKNESLKSFGDDTVLLEKFIADPRHIEVQIFSDLHQNHVHLFERDCSIQRRHQKIVEEAPPGLSEDVKHRLRQTAIECAKKINYVGAGTVEFIFDRSTDSFYFMEMNTRLQVEHPVTEMITGVDLVEWQIRVASGEELPVKEQKDILSHGHSVECRIYAEDPEIGFMPAAGKLVFLRSPLNDSGSLTGVRVDTGFVEGDEISVFYDPMIAKLVVFDSDREKALAKMKRALQQYQICGLRTNINFLLSVISSKAYIDGEISTNFIRDHYGTKFNRSAAIANIDRDVQLVQAGLGVLLDRQNKENNLHESSWKDDPFSCLTNQRFNYDFKQTVQLQERSEQEDGDEKTAAQGGHLISLTQQKNSNDSYLCTVNGNSYQVSGRLDSNPGIKNLRCSIGSRNFEVQFARMDNAINLFDESGCSEFTLPRPAYLADGGRTTGAADASALKGEVRSPMPGILDKVSVKEGQSVKEGDPLVSVISMKMEYVVRAPKAGVVKKILNKIGDNVGKDALLVSLGDD